MLLPRKLGWNCSHSNAYWGFLINVCVSLSGVSGPLCAPGAHVLSGHPEWKKFHLLLRAGLGLLKRFWTWRTLHPPNSSPTTNCSVLQKTLTVEDLYFSASFDSKTLQAQRLRSSAWSILAQKRKQEETFQTSRLAKSRLIKTERLVWGTTNLFVHQLSFRGIDPHK